MVWTNSLSMPPSAALCMAGMSPAGTQQPYCSLGGKIQDFIPPLRIENVFTGFVLLRIVLPPAVG